MMCLSASCGVVAHAHRCLSYSTNLHALIRRRTDITVDADVILIVSPETTLLQTGAALLVVVLGSTLQHDRVLSDSSSTVQSRRRC